jgi:Uri superfamily endonuclease
MDMHIQFELLSFKVLDIIMCSLMKIVIEMEIAVRLASQLENCYYWGSSDTNRDYDRITLIISK